MPNVKWRIYPDVKWKLRHVAHAELHTTVDEDGVIAEFDDNGEIKIHSGACQRAVNRGAAGHTESRR